MGLTDVYWGLFMGLKLMFTDVYSFFSGACEATSYFDQEHEKEPMDLEVRRLSRKANLSSKTGGIGWML